MSLTPTHSLHTRLSVQGERCVTLPCHFDLINVFPLQGRYLVAGPLCNLPTAASESVDLSRAQSEQPRKIRCLLENPPLTCPAPSRDSLCPPQRLEPARSLHPSQPILLQGAAGLGGRRAALVQGVNVAEVGLLLGYYEGTQ